MIVHRVDVYHQSGWYRRMIPIKDSVLSQNVGQGCFFIVKQQGSRASAAGLPLPRRVGF